MLAESHAHACCLLKLCLLKEKTSSGITVSDYISWTALTHLQDKWSFLLLPFNYFCFSCDLSALGLLY